MYNFNKQSKKSKLFKRLFLLTLIVGIVGFVGVEIYPFVHGPQLNLETLSDGTTLTEPLVALQGQARYTKDLFINGSPLATSPDGSFAEKLLLNPGYNVITVSAKDRFGSETNTTYRLMLREDEQQVLTLNVLSQVSY